MSFSNIRKAPWRFFECVFQIVNQLRPWRAERDRWGLKFLMRWLMTCLMIKSTDWNWDFVMKNSCNWNVNFKVFRSIIFEISIDRVWIYLFLKLFLKDDKIKVDKFQGFSEDDMKWTRKRLLHLRFPLKWSFINKRTWFDK